MTPDVPVRADLVVVGAGPAGCVVARRAAEAGREVLLLEAGAAEASRRAGLLDVGPGSQVTVNHRAESGGATLLLPRGSTLGGSGAVNGGYCAAARPADLSGWPGGGWPRRYAVGLGRAAERLRPRLVPADPVAARLAAVFPGRVESIAQARRGGLRVTAYQAWDPAGAGVRIERGTGVRRIRWQGGRAGGRCDGVVLADGREIAAREVVLCAGAIGTAALLLDSGIGPLSGHPVGQRTEEHPEILLDLAEFPAGGGTRGGPCLATAGPVLPSLLSRVIRLDIGGAGIEVRPYSVPMDRVIPGLAPQPHRIGVALMTPSGRGEIVPDGRGGVRVVLDAHPDPADAIALGAAADLVRDSLGISAPAVPSTSQHLSGSARMGEVVDDSGRVLGVAGLRVADASVFPSLPRCGPYYSVLAVAEDLAARIAVERPW